MFVSRMTDSILADTVVKVIEEVRRLPVSRFSPPSRDVAETKVGR